MNLNAQHRNPLSQETDDYYDDEDDLNETLFLSFRLGSDEYGISVQSVIEIVGIQKITVVPETLPFVMGVINLRGSIIPVVDVRARFGMESRQYDDRTCIVVVSIRKVTVGLIVDTVCEVLDIPPDCVSSPPGLQASQENRFILGLGQVNDEIKILLDVDRLLFDKELETLESSGITNEIGSQST